MIDRDIHQARALLIENNALFRSIAMAQLRNTGVGFISQVSRVRDARLMLERETFDIIICNREFEGCDDNGQDLLDELRRENLLPHSTVFLMVTERATYHQVMEAAEAALDGLLIRPYTGAALAERLLEARHRKRELGDILRALDQGQHEVALARALKRFQEQAAYANYCGRLVAELLLTLGRAADARVVFEKLMQPKNATWARLGVVRARLAGGDITLARRAVQAVLADDPGSADAHDLLGRILVEQCDFEGALAEYRQATALTPGCLLRRQHAGALAFYQGHSAEALTLLESALALGVKSKLFDALTLMLIAVLRLDHADTLGVKAMQEQLQGFARRFPDSQRLVRLCLAAEVLAALARQDGVAALAMLQALSAQCMQADFDLEAANTVLLLWARLPEAIRPAEQHEATLEQIGLRFCVSKAITEVLQAAARREEPALSIIRRCQARVGALAEQALDRATRGEAEAAVRSLLRAGQQLLNARLLELAATLARRYLDQQPELESLAQQASGLMKRYCHSATHIAGIQRAGRSPGGLQLRGRPTLLPADVTTA